MMKLRAYAKINIGLHILGKRSDGYHDLETVFREINCYDEIEMERNKKIIMTADSILVPVDGSNLCVRAATLLQKEKHVREGVQIHLKKNIPIGAGLGGGSSDAATVLRGLNRFWDLRISSHDLRALAAQIGADVPFFIEGGTAYATGRGELCEAFDLALPFWIAVVTPLVHISTAWAYSQVVPKRNGKSNGLRINIEKQLSSPQAWAAFLQNDFEPIVFQTHPELGRIKEQLIASGAVFSLMSGSGSSIFGLFETEKGATAALSSFPNNYQTSLTAPTFQSIHKPESAKS
jgi:4-diphosphocytidyl-2-C-methyl-D-erythritol kinase